MIDAHVHVWDLARGDYDWLAGEDRALHRDFTFADWAAAATPLGIDRAVLVQAAPTAAETEYLLSVAHANTEQVLGVVGWVELTDSDARTQLERFAADPLGVGVRPWLQAIEDPDWILRSDVGEGLDAIEDLGLLYEALALPAHLAPLIRVVEARPGLRVVLDHMAKPDIAHGGLEGWSADLRRLAEAGDVVCKLSGLVSEAGERTSAADLRPYVDVALDAFGPERVMWGSDWPVVSAVVTYAQWHDLARTLTPAAHHEQIFERTAERVYGRDRHAQRGNA